MPHELQQPSEFELDALKAMPYLYRSSCAAQWVEFQRCDMHSSRAHRARKTKGECEDVYRDFLHCSKIETSKLNGFNAINLHFNNPVQFAKDNPVPSLSKAVSLSWLLLKPSHLLSLFD